MKKKLAIITSVICVVAIIGVIIAVIVDKCSTDKLSDYDDEYFDDEDEAEKRDYVALDNEDKE